MSNITLNLDEATHRTARIVAAERGTSISGLVRDYLKNLRPSNEQAQLRDLLDTLDWAASTSNGQFSAASRMTREQAHDRETLRREVQA